MDGDSPRGAQSVARAALLLRLVTAQGERGGARTADLVAEAGLSRPTVHRLLTALKFEALLDQDSATGRWFPGPELFLMGSVAAERYDVTQRARDIVHSLAATTGESAFLSVRRGDETVCLVHEDGAFPIRSHVLSEGVRFPLGVASAGIVILALLPEEEAEAYLSAHDLVPRWGEAHSAPSVRERLAETRDRGYSVNPGLIVEGSWGMGAAVLSRAGRPEWALSITGVEFRFGEERRDKLGRALLGHAHELSQRMQRGAG